MFKSIMPEMGSLTREEVRMAIEDQVIERKLTRLRLAGPELSHSRRNNLEAVTRLANLDPYVTFGIRRVIEYVQEKQLEPSEALGMIAEITKCSKDLNHTEGRGYISPASTIKGLRAAGAAIRRVASEGGSVLFATGHPGAMIDFYTELAYLVRRLGGRVFDLTRGQIVQQGEDRDHVKVVDSVNSIAFLSDTCAALHTHDSRPMEMMLDGADRMPDLVVADHGFAGEAINRDIPTVAVMDTNDPGLAVAKHLGANVILVPMNDNRPNVVTREAAELLKHMALEGRHAYR
jgi:ribosomal protein S2